MIAPLEWMSPWKWNQLELNRKEKLKKLAKKSHIEKCLKNRKLRKTKKK